MPESTFMPAYKTKSPKYSMQDPSSDSKTEEISLNILVINENNLNPSFAGKILFHSILKLNFELLKQLKDQNSQEFNKYLNSKWISYGEKSISLNVLLKKLIKLFEKTKHIETILKISELVQHASKQAKTSRF